MARYLIEFILSSTISSCAFSPFARLTIKSHVNTNVSRAISSNNPIHHRPRVRISAEGRLEGVKKDATEGGKEDRAWIYLKNMK